MHPHPITPILSAVALALLLAVPAAASAQPGVAPSHRTAKGGLSNVSYSSSVDHFALSYLEWLPSGFVSTKSHDLVVFLHGMGTSTQTVKGGIGGDSVPTGLVKAASAAKVILISINTRSSAGFYANTACGGPQEQDVLDAIAHEQALRKVSAIDLVGFSMGTVGALVIAATHTLLIHAVALVAPLTDLFEEEAYTGAPIPQLQADLCGAYPSPLNRSTDAFFTFLSPLRFAPTNFSEFPMYVTAGGADNRAPNNFALWPYAMANSTIVNSSCRVASTLGETSTCTSPLHVLAKSNAGDYSVRFVYEPSAGHSSLQLDATDFFDFLSGRVSAGLYLANFPPTHIVPAP